MLLRRHGQLEFRRRFFKKLKQLPKFGVEEDSGHHEYSITPETFAFKVSDDHVGLSGNAHPLQKDGSAGFNLLGYIYKNATNYPFHEHLPQDVFNRYPMTSLARLARLQHRPRKVKMLALDFIEDSLYNPNYGYFSKEVEIFHSDKPFDYNDIEDVDLFMDAWKLAYSKYDDPARTQPQPEPQPEAQPALPNAGDSRLARYAKSVQRQDLQASGTFPQTKASMQLWHTPTELFSPYYGEALARYIIVNYKLNGCYPYDDLIIYEMGGGNGTLMCNVLQYIKNNEPDIYARTQYKIIEISSQLAQKQFALALELKLVAQGLDTSKLEIINKSIFKWDKTVQNHCFFIALEVFDNFAHDVVRYDITTGEPHEGHVLIDETGNFYQFFTPQLSYYTNALLHLRENGEHPVLPQLRRLLGKLQKLASTVPFLPNKDDIHPLLHSAAKMKWQHKLLPLKDNLSPGEFVPTRLLQFFHILKHRFPNHSLISSDFNSLTNTIPGYYNGPVVQTIIKDRMVDVSTYMSHQGYFDIMFATDFALASDLYRKVTGKLAKVELHRDFLELWADVDITTTKSGDNPMLDFYKNVSFMVS